MIKKFSAGTIHSIIPADLKTMLSGKKEIRQRWEAITPLARNEWLCWIESAKLDETRSRRLKRLAAELAEGKTRPCCWIGCIHRTDKAISPSVQGILARRGK